ncbi:glutathione S-transferase family protein [Arenibaculum sp.]|jgi:glutathione S-transferase|uniref:glutathione S-transferase family protein n=1 Tax=Arenibaculum sp. TaxID=2865862 RepID=UPI002E15D017|nr:glutathione S-transferase family protein [Arenibaculum sp.]
MRLFDMPDSGNCYKVRLMLALLGRRFERIVIDPDAGETRTAEFLALNPYGKVPVLEVSPGEFLPESNAILCHLAEGTPYLPAAGMDRARVMQWLFWEQYSHEPNIAVARHWLKHLELDEARRAELAVRQEKGRAALEALERRLTEADWLAAGRFTTADVALFAYTHVAPEGGIGLNPFPAVRAWIARVEDVPGFVPLSA